jgi:capsule polysaccharide modification protein KpsS
MAKNIPILEGKRVAYIDDFQTVYIRKSKGCGTIKSQTVEAVLLLEIVRILKANSQVE